MRRFGILGIALLAIAAAIAFARAYSNRASFPATNDNWDTGYVIPDANIHNLVYGPSGFFQGWTPSAP